MPAPDESEACAEARRQELSRWLQQRRESVPPASVGLKRSRRRSTGLTQVEVARLAHIGRRTYQQFEQGHVRPRPEVFAAIVAALRLTQVEIERLRYLADMPEPAEPRPLLQTASADAVVPLLAPFRVPALVYDAALTVVAWNQAAAAMAPGLVEGDLEQINLARWLFTADAARVFFVDFDAVAREAIGRLRVKQIRHGNSTVLDPLVEELCASSPLARQLWDDETVVDFEPGRAMYRLRGPNGAVHTMSFATVALLGNVPSGLRMIYALSPWPPSSHPPTTGSDGDRPDAR